TKHDRIMPARAAGRLSAARAGRALCSLAALAAGLTVAAVPGLPLAAASPASQPSTARAACAPPRAGHMRCFVVFRTRQGEGGASGPRAALAAATPSGWGAKAIEAAYNLPVRRGAGQTVAVVDAYHTPGLASYLAAYRREYGLPACTAASGCFRQVNQ